MSKNLLKKQIQNKNIKKVRSSFLEKIKNNKTRSETEQGKEIKHLLLASELLLIYKHYEVNKK